MRDRYESRISFAPSAPRRSDGPRAGRDPMAKTDRPFAGSSVMSGWNRCALVLLALTAGSAAYADTITTLFASNNSGSPGGGVYFDVTVGANPIEIISFEVNSNAVAGANIAFEAYTRPGGHRGFENSPNGWTLEATGFGTTAGLDLPSAVNLNNTFVLPANTTVGMALTLGSDAGHAYTNGNGANQRYADGNVQLDLGTTNNSLFGAGLFSPRVWNGSITYNVIPEPSSLVLLASGCLALLRRRMSRNGSPIRYLKIIGRRLLILRDGATTTDRRQA